jgi:hypothetical protein
MTEEIIDDTEETDPPLFVSTKVGVDDGPCSVEAELSDVAMKGAPNVIMAAVLVSDGSTTMRVAVIVVCRDVTRRDVLFRSTILVPSGGRACKFYLAMLLEPAAYFNYLELQ